MCILGVKLPIHVLTDRRLSFALKRKESTYYRYVNSLLWYTPLVEVNQANISLAVKTACNMMGANLCPGQIWHLLCVFIFYQLVASTMLEALTMLWGSHHVAAILHEVWQRIHRRICTIGKKSCINPDQSNHKLTHTHSVFHATSYHWHSRLLLALKKRQTAACEKSVGYTPLVKVNQAMLSLVV